MASSETEKYINNLLPVLSFSSIRVDDMIVFIASKASSHLSSHLNLLVFFSSFLVVFFFSKSW